ncbi:MAG TPA: M20/M25/M40 family metallo-hydrolase [Vicinamibacteria bacterium]|nr:M20/M25/M40 family metallo-hydrolase [Vicinamibacteria bacterium]
MPSPTRTIRPAVALALLLPLATPARAQEDPAARYRETAGRILGRALVDEGAWTRLEYLTTRIGHRLSGSPSLDKAVAWAHEEMKAEGLDGARLQAVKVPRWVRGREWARVVSPAPRELPMLGLGMSVGTPKEGVTAPVVVVRSFEELTALGRERVEGKIVAFAPDWEGYGRTVRFRSSGASAAAKLGALAALVRSATGRSIASPHTGALDYEEGAPKIPAASITVEDAEWLRRMAAAGQAVTVSLFMEARLEGDADSANVIAEIRGSEKPDEVVVMGGHYDSWDVGQGAHDDGCSCMAAWQALTILKELGLRPRRTLRVVLWANEENGLRGGKAYREALGASVASHVAAIEMDGGCERPVGFGFSVVKPGAAPPSRRGGGPAEAPEPDAAKALATLRRIGSLFDGIDAAPVKWGGGGADISPLTRDGVPGLSLDTVGEHYFDWHHTHADTIDKVDPGDLRRATGMLAVMGYALADMPGRLAP